MKTKLLVVNLQDPSKTKYWNAKNIGVFMLGRRLSNYKLFVVDQTGNMKPVVITNADILLIQQQVLDMMKG
jgi:hypothetical protein